MDDLKARFELSKQNGELFVLTEDDLKIGIADIQKPIESIDDLVMVHITNYMPDGSVRTPESAAEPKPYTKEYKIGDKSFVFQMTKYNHRNTVHFCLNGKTEPHMWRPVDATKYAVIMPLSTNKDKIVAGTECDLFSYGDVEIKGDAFILCIESEAKKVRQANPNATIVACKGDKIDPYVNIFITNVLGYKYKEPKEEGRSWTSMGVNDPDKKVASSIIESNGWEYRIHSGSTWDDMDHLITVTDELSQTISNIQKLNILSDNSSLEKINSIILAVLNRSFQLYTYISAFFNPELKKYISDRIFKETGITIEMDENIDTSDIFKSDKQAQYIANSIIYQLRSMALSKKENSDDKMPIEERIERDINKKLDNLHKFKSAVATSREAKNIDFLKQLGNYKDKKLDELTEEELDEVISFINFVGNTLYNGPFKLYRSYDEEETQNIYSTISMKSTPFDTAKTKMVSDIIPLEDFKKNLQELDDIHGFLKNIFSQFDSHVAVLDESTIKTDFDISRCVTVEDLISSSINYLACINKLYNGEHIKFDKYGVLVQEDNMTL